MVRLAAEVDRAEKPNVRQSSAARVGHPVDAVGIAAAATDRTPAAARSRPHQLVVADADTGTPPEGSYLLTALPRLDPAERASGLGSPVRSP
jgi:hypothetical protein